MPLITGIFVKILGNQNLFILMAFAVLLGHTLSTFAVYYQFYPILLIGRVFLGIGHTNIATPRSVMTSHWFIGQELGFAFSTFGSVGRVMMSLAGLFFGVYNNKDPKYLYIPLTITWFICIVAFIGAIFTIILYNKNEALVKQKE